tara:strand:- start:930 stop:1259 length:330 start_codon:yes stop_codon:yes gene_type:complete
MLKKLDIDHKSYKEARCKLIIISITFIAFVFLRVLVSTIIISSRKFAINIIIIDSFKYFLIFEVILISLVIYVDYKNLYESHENVKNIGNVSEYVKTEILPTEERKASD